MNFYNDNDPNSCTWLENLVKAGKLPNGKVDCRSITEIKPEELDGFTQCHFFCGIGGWSVALQLAGWPEDEEVWTGSCPCQPFSTAGNNLGRNDPRHLWPAFFQLIQKRKPKYVFGEQASAAIKKGWLDEVANDLEAESYAVGAAVLGAFSVSAPHERKRLYWAAADTKRERGARLVKGENTSHARPWGLRSQEDLQSLCDHPFERLGNHLWPEPLLRRVDDGLPGRLGKLHGFGNAIVPQCGAEFITAFMGALDDEQAYYDTVHT